MDNSSICSTTHQEKSECRFLFQSASKPACQTRSDSSTLSFTTDKGLLDATMNWKEIKMQCWLAGPMILVNVLMYSWQTISVAFVGHLGELALSSASIATSLAGVTGSSLLLGMSCALETICGQAYGAKQYHLLGVYLQKAIVVLNATSLLLAVIWCNMEKFLIAVGQDPSISKEAGKYARWLIPTLFAYASAHPITKFLQVQSLVFPLVICALIALFCHVPICWFMVYKSGLGSQGAALATSISNWIYVVLMMIYVRFSRACEKSWTSFSWEALKDLNGFLKLALSSTMMIWC